MSKYLIDAIAGIPNVDVRTGTQVVGVKADGQLREVLITSPHSQTAQPLRANAMFICIGGEPRTDAVGGTGLVIDDTGFVPTGSELASFTQVAEGWDTSRPPLPLESNLPGLFAAGDVRRGSTKRSAAVGEGSMSVALVHQRLAEIGGESRDSSPDLSEHALAEFSQVGLTGIDSRGGGSPRAQRHSGAGRPVGRQRP